MLRGHGLLHTQVFSDLSLITAISNDMGYEWVFAEPLRRRAEAGDMLAPCTEEGVALAPNAQGAELPDNLEGHVETIVGFLDAEG